MEEHPAVAQLFNGSAVLKQRHAAVPSAVDFACEQVVPLVKRVIVIDPIPVAGLRADFPVEDQAVAVDCIFITIRDIDRGRILRDRFDR